MSRRPGFPHRVTLDLTEDQYETLNNAAEAAGGATLVDYMRALIELHTATSEQDLNRDLVERTEKQLRAMRQTRRRTRRTRRSPERLAVA